MTIPQFIGAIDQGTTSTRFVIFNQDGELVTYHQMEFEQHYKHPGYSIQFACNLFYVEKTYLKSIDGLTKILTISWIQYILV